MKLCTLLTLCTVLFFAAAADNREGVIPNRLFVAGTVLAVFCRALEPQAAAAGKLASGFCFVCILTGLWYRHRIGGGDVKMVVFIQLLYPGYTGILIFWFCLLYASAAGLIGYLRFGNRRVRLGAGLFLGAVTAAMGGYL